MANKLPYMQLEITAYLTDTIDLTVEQHGVYLLLLMLAWRRRNEIPDNPEFIRRALEGCAVRLHGNRFNNLVMPILERFFYRTEDGKWANKRLGNDLETAEKRSGTARENVGKRWGRLRENKDLADTDVILIEDKIIEEKKEFPLSPPKGELGEGEEPTKKGRRKNPIVKFEHPSFEEFWSVYPRRQNNPRKPASLIFARVVKAGADPLAIIAAARTYADYVRSEGKEGTGWVAMATTWLNQERWADEMELPLSPEEQRKREAARFIEEHNAKAIRH